MALVVGIGAYEHARPLSNTISDARDIAERLEANGIEVDLLLDPGRDALLAALDDFSF